MSRYEFRVYAYKLDAGAARETLLDSDIDRGSFAVGGRHIYWSKGGQPHTATMP